MKYPFPDTLSADGNSDTLYPGTATHRLTKIVEKVIQIPQHVLDGEWEPLRQTLLQAGGLKVTRSTSHAFQDDNHCDITPMLSKVSHEHNANGAITSISRNNHLGSHIKLASIVDGDFRFDSATPSGAGSGSWSTCTNGAHSVPPTDVAHTQFRSRIAFKLVWCPPGFEKFVLVDDEGAWLKTGKADGGYRDGPGGYSRSRNYRLVRGGKYADVAEEVGRGKTPSRVSAALTAHASPAVATGGAATGSAAASAGAASASAGAADGGGAGGADAGAGADASGGADAGGGDTAL